MRRIISAIFIVFCLFSFNTSFQINSALAAPELPQQELPELPMDGKVDDDVLREPIFNTENKKPKKNKVVVKKMTNIFKKVLCAALLLVLTIICGSFIWFANLQRRRDARRKKQSANSNVIDAVDNFARHRIK